MYRKLGQTGPLYEAIVGEIEQMVLSGELKPGDILPPERELAERFGVSRTAVREATKVLSQKQLVTVLRGRGIVVVHPSPTAVTTSLGLLLKIGGATQVELTEVRKVIEPELAALAAVRATPEQVRALEDLATDYAESVGKPQEAVLRDVAFHGAISEAAGNRVAKAIIASIQELFFESMLHDYRVEGALERAIRSHRLICSAIKERDAEAARRYMQEHLENVSRDQELTLSRSTKVGLPGADPPSVLATSV